MSRRNDYDYFDLDNFDDSLDSRDYRRRTQRGNGSYNRRPSQGGYRRPKKRINKRRIRNRIIIVTSAVVVLAVIIFVLSSIFNSCTRKADEALATVSTSTVSKNTETTAGRTDVATGDLAPDYFVTPSIKDDNTNGEMVYNIYVWHKEGFELFGSDDTKAKKYAETVNGFANRFASDVKIYDMVIPNHTEMGLSQRIKDSGAPSGSQAVNIKDIYSALSNRVVPINCYNRLAQHNSEYIYFKSDHHWTGLGAYYAYTAFADSNNLPVLPLEDCTEYTIDGFTGTFHNTASNLDVDAVHYWDLPYDVTMDVYNNSDGTPNTFDSPYYKYATGGPYTYGVFLEGDNALTVLKSSSEKAAEGKKIAVVKESYGNAFAPYLTYNYDEVHVIDFRYFSGNLITYCQEHGIKEVLFANGIMSANTQIQLDSMSSLFN